MMRRAIAGVLLCFIGCADTHVVRLPVEAKLAEADAPPKNMVTGVRIAFKRPKITNDPERRVDFTNVYAESYPSLSHMVVAVPMALRESGFDVVEVDDVKDAEALRADFVLDLAMPQVAAFHPATGDRITLVGSSYDVRVSYRGSLSTGDLRPIGLVSGYGQNTQRFFFMEPLFREAVIGAFVAFATMASSIFMLGIIFQVGALSSLANGGDPFGICTEKNAANISQFDKLPKPPWDESGKQGVSAEVEGCTRVANQILSSVFVSATGVVTGVATGFAGRIGEAVFTAGLALAYMLGVDPIWRRMVKRAHDQAARDLAAQMTARALNPLKLAPRPIPKPAAPPPPVAPVEPLAPTTPPQPMPVLPSEELPALPPEEAPPGAPVLPP